MLNQYLQQTQRFLRDQRQEQLEPGDLTDYINRARREVAMRGACLRLITPITGSIKSFVINAPGAGYVSPTLSISPPDFPDGIQAAGTIALTGGAITGVSITNSGSGYFQPVTSIVDPTGAGAMITPVLSFLNETITNKETYPFSAVDLSPFPGFEVVYTIRSVSVIYSNYRYSLPCYAFSTYQALFRSYLFYQFAPAVAAQVGKGTAGVFYFYPIPSQPFQLEWDCLCLPSDLIDDLSVEAIPQPFTDAVPFLAAYYAYLELQNMNAAAFYEQQFDKWMQRYGAYTMPGRAVNPYGRPY